MHVGQTNQNGLDFLQLLYAHFAIPLLCGQLQFSYVVHFAICDWNTQNVTSQLMVLVHMADVVLTSCEVLFTERESSLCHWLVSLLYCSERRMKTIIRPVH